MKKISNLIHTDLITINGGKNNMKVILVLIIFLFCGMGITVSPLGGLYVPLLTGGFLVPTLFQNEIKYHNEKMFALLPISRKDLVNSRFIMCTGIYLIINILTYLLMLLSMKIELYKNIFTDESGENIEPLSMLADKFGNSFTVSGLFNLIYFGVFSFGLIITSGNLCKYFRSNDSFNLTISIGTINKSKKKEYIIAIIIFSIIILWVLVISDILPIGHALTIISRLFSQLAGMANGLLSSIVLVTIAIMSTIYKYICTILEYEEREL